MVIITLEDLKVKVKEAKELDIFEISNQLKKIMDKGIENLNSLKQEDNDDIDDKELSQYLKELDKQSERIANKFVKGLGQMYKGVLIKDELSIREDGGVYRYRHQRKMDYDRVAEMLLRYKDDVISNMGVERAGITFDVIDKILKEKEIKDDQQTIGNRKNMLNIDTSMAEGVKDVKPFNIFDFEKKNSYSSSPEQNRLIAKGKMLKIDKLKFNRGRITFENDDDTLRNETIHKLCLDKHKDVITQIRTEIVNVLQTRKNELDEIEKVVDDKMGKYILVAELK